MTTLVNNPARKVKSIEVKYSNMTFKVLVYCNYINTRNKSEWSSNIYTAIIKETNEMVASSYPDRESIKTIMAFINSKKDVFVK
jgi:hypothetical protein